MIRGTAVVICTGWLLAVAASIVMPARARPRWQAELSVCRSHEHRIGHAIEQYQRRHAGHYPPELANLMADDLIAPDTLLCVATHDTPATLPASGPTTRQAAIALAAGGHLSYVYCGHADWTDRTVPADAVVLYEPPGRHGDGANLLFGDGHAEFVARPRAARLIAAASATSRPVSAATVP